MRREARLGLVVVLWLVAVSLPARAVVLRYSPEVGTSLTYTYAMYMDQTADQNAAAMPAASRAVTQAAISLRIVDQTAEGVREQGTVRGGDFTLSLPGAQVSDRKAVFPETTFAITVDGRGGLHDLVVSGPGGAVGDLVLAVTGFSAFPEGDVKPGDTWTAVRQASAAGAAWAVNLKVKCHLLELVTYAGRPCATIRVIYSGPASAASPAVVSGQMQGTVLGYYDYERSVWVAQEGEASGLITLRIPREQGKGPRLARATLTKRYVARLAEPAASVPAP